MSIGSSPPTRFFFELDRGTETHPQLRAKLRRYSEVSLLNDVPRVLLFACLTERREVEVRGDLHSPGLTVATTALERVMTEPLGPGWQPLKHPFRVPLLELASATMVRSQTDE